MDFMGSRGYDVTTLGLLDFLEFGDSVSPRHTFVRLPPVDLLAP
jgi:hypothetical protein